MLITMTMALMFLAADANPQPESEAAVAARFVEASPVLFDAWVAVRPEALRVAGRGRIMEPLTAACSTAYVYEFLTCEDNEPPKLVSIDVRKTESILSPYVGVMRVSVNESCHSRRVVPSKVKWKEKAHSQVKDSCVGKSFDECISAGARPAPKLLGAACTGGPSTEFSFQSDDVEVYFRWSMGKWEFDREGEVDRRPA